MAVESGTQSSQAWQPMTPGGAAAFGAASWGRLGIFLALFGAFIALGVVWLVHTAVFPVIGEGVKKLPASGRVSAGALAWSAGSPVLLAEGRVIAFAVDLEHTGAVHVPSDLFVQFGRNTWRISSIAGFAEWPYRRDVLMEFNRPVLEPWWGAWRVPILWLVFLGAMLLLMAWWVVQATLYLPIALLLAFYTDRAAKIAAMWRVCAAAILPASLMVYLGIVLYGGAMISLVTFCLLVAGHVPLGIAFVVAATLALPREKGLHGSSKNPFSGRKSDE